MARSKDRFTPSIPVEGASAAASRSVRNAMAVQPESLVTVTPIPDTVPTPPRQRSPAGQAIIRIRGEINDLELHAPPGEEVYLDVLDVGSDFTVLRVRESSAEEIAFDGLDARGKAAKAVQHYTRLAYYLRTEAPAPAHRPIGFHFHGDPDPAA